MWAAKGFRPRRKICGFVTYATCCRVLRIDKWAHLQQSRRRTNWCCSRSIDLTGKTYKMMAESRPARVEGRSVKVGWKLRRVRGGSGELRTRARCGSMPLGSRMRGVRKGGPVANKGPGAAQLLRAQRQQGTMFVYVRYMPSYLWLGHPPQPRGVDIGYMRR